MEGKGREAQSLRGENALTGLFKCMENISVHTFSCQIFAELSGGLWKQNNPIFRQDAQVCTGMYCVVRTLRERDLCGSEHHVK